MVFLEHELLYGVAFDVDEKYFTEETPIKIGEAKIEREGKDVTIVGYSRTVQVALEAAKELESKGISSEVL